MTRHLGGRYEEEPVVGVIRLVLELRELRGADHRLAAHEERRCDLRVPVLTREVEHERRQRTLQPRAVTAQDDEARAADLHGALEVEDTEALTDLVVRLRIEGEVRCITPGARDDVVLGTGAVGNAFVRRVGHLEQQRVDTLLELREARLALLDALLERGQSDASLLVGRLAAHRGGRGALLGSRLLDLGAQAACLGVDGEQLIDGRALALPARALAHRVGVIADALHRQHQASPPRCCGRIVGNSSTSRMVGESVSIITSRSTPMPSPPAGGMPTSMASRKSSSMGGISESPAARKRACSSKRARWSIGSLSSLNALASSRPATISSKRSTKRGSSRRRRASGLTSAG